MLVGMRQRAIDPAPSRAGERNEARRAGGQGERIAKGEARGRSVSRGLSGSSEGGGEGAQQSRFSRNE